MKRRVKKRVRQTSDRVSALAARWLAKLRNDYPTPNMRVWIKSGTLATLCASLVNQDQTKGPRKK